MTEQNPGAPDVASRPPGRHAASDDATATTAAGTTDDPAGTETPADTETSAGGESAAGAESTQSTQTTQTTAGTDETTVVAAQQPSEPATEQVEAPTQTVAAQQPTEPATERVEAPTQTVATQQPTEPETRQMPEPVVASGRAAGPRRSAGPAVRSVARRVAMALRLIGGLFALVLVVFIVLTALGVNEQNAFAQLVAGGADALVMDFRDLFLPTDERVMIGVNYGLAALFWLAVAGLAASVIQRLARLVP